jgi:hypothetical protein
MEVAPLPEGGKIDVAGILGGIAQAELIWMGRAQLRPQPGSLVQGRLRRLAPARPGLRQLKDVLALRPIYHRIEMRVKAHIFVAALALLVERLLHRRLPQARIDLPPERAMQALAAVRHVTIRLDGQPERHGVSSASQADFIGSAIPWRCSSILGRPPALHSASNRSLYSGSLPECHVRALKAIGGLLFSQEALTVRFEKGFPLMAICTKAFRPEPTDLEILDPDEFAQEIRQLAIDAWRSLSAPEPSLHELTGLTRRFDNLLRQTEEPGAAEINRWLVSAHRVILDRLNADAGNGGVRIRLNGESTGNRSVPR